MLNRDANLLRDMRRRLEIAQMFRELAGAERIEAALLDLREYKLEQKRRSFHEQTPVERAAWNATRRAWIARLKTDLDAYRRWQESHAAHMKRYREDVKQDPARLERRRKLAQANQARYRNDPVKGEKLRERQRRYMRAWRAKPVSEGP